MDTPFPSPLLLTPPSESLVCRQYPDGAPAFPRRCDLIHHLRAHAARPPAFRRADVSKRASNCNSHMQSTHGVPYERAAAATTPAVTTPAVITPTPRPTPLGCFADAPTDAAVVGAGGLLTPVLGPFPDLDLLAADDAIFFGNLHYFGRLDNNDQLPPSAPTLPLSPLPSPCLAPTYGGGTAVSAAGISSSNANGRGTKRARESSSGSSSGSDGDDDDDDDADDASKTPGEDEGGGRRPRGPPRQRLRTAGPDDADEDQMPCPFHLADPAYFSRGCQERFSPCHTRHRYISTLLRHLGRAAHRLRVSDAAASSFGVVEAARPQPQAGLCRRCWTAFRDEAAFDAHVRRATAAGAGGRDACARVSRSKREKFRVVLETFCAPADQAEDGEGDSDSDSDSGSDSDSDPDSDEETDAKTDQTHSPKTLTAPTPAPAPGPGSDPGPPAPAATPADNDYVRRSELLAVLRRLDQLEAYLRATHAGAGTGTGTATEAATEAATGTAAHDASPEPAATVATVAPPAALPDDEAAVAPFGFEDWVDTSQWEA